MADQMIALRSIASLETLRSTVQDDNAIHALTTLVPSWDQLRKLSTEQQSNLLGKQYVLPLLPPEPTRAPLGSGVRCLTRYQIDYPANLRSLRTPPLLIYVKGELPSSNVATILGTKYPSPIGIEMARDSARAAVAAGFSVAVRHQTQLGSTAISEVLNMGGTILLVCAQGVDAFGTFDGVAKTVLSAHGCVVTTSAPMRSTSSVESSSADNLLVGLSDIVIIPEAAPTPDGGRFAVSKAIKEGKLLVVPSVTSSDGDLLPFPSSAVGSAALSLGPGFDESMFGINTKIHSRLRSGLTAADFVVSTPADLADAFAFVKKQ